MLRLAACPYCEVAAERVTRVEVTVDPEPAPAAVDKPAATPDPQMFHTRCAEVFEPCGHAFWKDDVDGIVDALRELQRLRVELRNCEDADRIRDLTRYEIPAAENAVDNRWREIERVERAEEYAEDDDGEDEDHAKQH